MRFWVFAVVASILLSGCAQKSDERHYPLHGQVLSLDPAHELVTIKHDDIKGFMPAMTMPYSVKELKLLDGVVPGDVVDATLVVFSNGAHLTAIKKVGTAPLEPPPAETATPKASSGFELLKTGEAVPDTSFLDQNGRKRRFADLKGSTVVMTFIYTKCPLPTFCPLMDRHFVAIQKVLKTDPSLAKVHLVTVSFDPVTDTPAVLKAHAKTLDADLSRWTFLTGDRDEIDQFGARFGVSVSRALNDARDITHNLRTVIVDADGKLVKVYTGNEWTPAQILDDLKGVVRAN
ncbi:MAG TPA: SCO family protein [Vicinamibacterales bacterium]|jgi:protein SCO1/2